MSREKSTDRTQVTISLDEATKRRLKKLAKANHVTVSGMISAWAWSQEIPKNDDTEDDEDE